MAFQFAPYLASSVAGVGVLGAIIGGAAAAAKNIQLLRGGKTSQWHAIVDTGRETAGAGVATAFSAAAVDTVGAGLMMSVGVAVVAGVAGKFACDRGMEYIEAQVTPRPNPPPDDEFTEAMRSEGIADGVAGFGRLSPQRRVE